MVTIIIGPEAPQPPPKPTTTIPTLGYITADPLDGKIVELVDHPDGQSVPIWTVVHKIVEGERPVDRTQRRRLVARLLCRLRGLLRAGSVERVGKGHVRLRQPVKQTPIPAPKPVQNVPSVPYPTVMDTTTFQGGGPCRRVFNA